MTEPLCFRAEKKQNNLVSELLEVAAISKSGNSFKFTRSNEGWIFISATYKGKGKLKHSSRQRVGQRARRPLSPPTASLERSPLAEAVRRVAKGEHEIRVDCEGNVSVDKLVVKSIPELVQCGLNSSSIKSYGPFDMEFLKKDVLPNVTTLIVSPGDQASPVRD